MGNILVCDDERSICELLDIALRRDGHKVETVTGGELAKRKIDSALFDVIVTDIKMPGVDGVEVLRHAHQISPESAVILMTAVDDYEAAVQAVKAGGATDYIRKSPGLVDEVKLAIARSLTKVSLSRQNFALRRDAATRNSLDNIVGASPALEKLKQTIRTVATTSSTILIYGESGTGKELVARAIHTCLPRAAEAFVSVNCGAFPETLLESELFGYMKGAFTGANENRQGLFQAASGGMCSSVRPRVVIAGVPRRMPDGSKGLRWSNGTELKFSSMPARSRALAAGLPAIPLAVRSTSSRWLSVPPDTRS